MKNKLVTTHINLIYYVLKQLNLYSKSEEYFDVGMIGLISGINTYKDNKGYRISTYLSMCIKNEILKELRKENAYKRLSNKNTISLNKNVHNRGEDECMLVDFFKSDTDIENDLIKNELIKKMYSELSKLKERDRFIIFKRYGLDDNKRMTQKEVADALNVKQSTICTIENRIIEDLKVKLTEY